MGEPGPAAGPTNLGQRDALFSADAMSNPRANGSKVMHEGLNPSIRNNLNT